MVRFLIIAGICILLPACASAPKPDLAAVQARPVLAVGTITIDIEAKLKEAQQAYESRNFNVSFDAYSQVLLQDRMHAQAWLGRANSALALGLRDEASESFLKVDVSDLVGSDKRQLLAGLALITSGYTQSVDKEERLKLALAFTPNDIRLWNMLGQHYDQNSQWEKSTDLYVEALKLGESRDSVVNNLGTSLMYQGRLEDARTKFQQAQNIAPDSELYDNNLRLIEALQGNYDAAMDGLKPKKAALILNDAGMIAFTRGEKQTAKMLLQRAIDVSPVFHAQAYANLQKAGLSQ